MTHLRDGTNCSITHRCSSDALMAERVIELKPTLLPPTRLEDAPDVRDASLIDPDAELAWDIRIDEGRERREREDEKKNH